MLLRLLVKFDMVLFFMVLGWLISLELIFKYFLFIRMIILDIIGFVVFIVGVDFFLFLINFWGNGGRKDFGVIRFNVVVFVLNIMFVCNLFL